MSIRDAWLLGAACAALLSLAALYVLERRHAVARGAEARDAHARAMRTPLVCVAMVAASLLLELVSFQSWAAGAALLIQATLQLVSLLLFLTTLLSVLPLLLIALFKRVWAVPAARALFVLLALASLGFLSAVVSSDARDRAEAEFCRRMDVVVDAIVAYERDHGAPPDSLAQLKPGYLAGMPEAPDGHVRSLRYETTPAADTSRAARHRPRWALRAVVLGTLGDEELTCTSNGAHPDGFERREGVAYGRWVRWGSEED